MPWYLVLAWRQLFPFRRKGGNVLFGLFSVLGVALGVMILVVTQSVMGGFGEAHRDRMVESSGHVEIHAGGQPFTHFREIVADVEARPGVQMAAPYARGFFMAVHGDFRAFPLAMGLDLFSGGEARWQRFLLIGSVNDLDDHTVLLSRALAMEIGARVGRSIEVFSPLMFERMAEDEIVLPLDLEVVGIYDLEWQDAFVPGMIVSLRTLQEMYGLGDAVHGIMVWLENGVDPYAEVAFLEENVLASPVAARTWREIWSNLLWVLELERTILFFIVFLIMIVAVFAIGGVQLLLVMRKTREIGLLGSMGARPLDILRLYCFQGLVVAVFGIIAGIALALIILHFRDPIVLGLAEITGRRDTLVQFYYFTYLPVRYTVQDFVVIICATLVVSLLASFLPALRAARLRPAEALRADLG